MNIILLGHLKTAHRQVFKLLDAKIHKSDITEVEANLGHLTKLTVFSFDRASFDFLVEQSKFTVKFFDIAAFISGLSGTSVDSSSHDRFSDYDVLLFRKASDPKFNMHRHEVYKSASYYTYVSGYSPDRPKTDGSSVLVGPRWPWMTGLDSCISGVNFVGELLDAVNAKREQPKEINAIYVGSSSLNKNAVFAYFVLLVSRFYAFCSGAKTNPDIFLVTKFYGLKGELIWQVLRLLRIINRFFRINISFRMVTEDRLAHKNVAELIGSAEYGLVLYLREGYPRVIGEFLEMGAEPIVWSGTKFGNRDFLVENTQYRLIDIVGILSGKKLKPVESAHLRGRRGLSLRRKVDEILNGWTLRKVSAQLETLPEKNRKLFFYVMLTNDISWVQEM